MFTYVLIYVWYDYSEFIELEYATGSASDLMRYLYENDIPKGLTYNDNELTEDQKKDFNKREYSHYRIIRFTKDGKESSNTGKEPNTGEKPT